MHLFQKVRSMLVLPSVNVHLPQATMMQQRRICNVIAHGPCTTMSAAVVLL